MFATSFLLLVLSTCVSLCHCSGTQTIYIEPAKGERCPQNASSCLNVTAFGSMADEFSYSSDMVVYFLEGTHLLALPGLVVFRGLHNATFVGLGRMEQGFHETVWQSTVVIRCTNPLQSSGIAFSFGSNITFKSITITNCGARAESVLSQNNPFCSTPVNTTTLFFFRVANITIDQVSVQNGSGFGLSVVSDGFDVTISSSSFVHNSALNDDVPTGGNIFLIYTDPLECPDEFPMLQMYNAHITSTNVSFGLQTLNSIFTGGGLVIYMEQTLYTMDVVLDFLTAYNSTGSNIELITTNEVPSYTLLINNTRSSHAFAALAGGLFIHTSLVPLCTCFSLVRNSTGVGQCVILNSIFTENYVVSFGGGIVINLEASTYSLMVVIESTEISCNEAIFATGLLFEQTLYSIDTHSNQSNITLNNVTFNNNYERPNETRFISAVIAIFYSNLKLNNVRITNSNSAGFLAYSTIVTVGNGSESIFHNNSGVDGGGLALHQGSYLMLEKGAHLTFTNNSATGRGGAIFVDTPFSFLPSLCFFQYLDPKPLSARIYFSGNEAGEAGSVLYGGNIDQCTLLSLTPDSPFNLTFNYSHQTGPSVISSDPSQVCFCQNDIPDCSLDALRMSAYPGEKITIPLVTVGQRNGVVPGTVRLQGTHDTPAIDSQLYGTNALRCTNLFIELVITDNFNLSTDFVVNSVVLSEFSVISRVSKQPIKFLNITVQPCPMGFQLSNDTHKSCDCLELKQNVPNIVCNVTSQRIIRRGDIWIGFDNTSNCTIVVTHCPFDYCNTSEVSFTLTDPDSQCALSRTGTLCGSCRDGLSLSLGSNNCIQCPDSSHVALILPFAAAGFGLVALLMVLNLTVSAGTINGLIFYANIVKVNESIFFPHPIPVLSQFISWLNLDLGIETCFFSGMTAYAKVWLQFVFPVYIWVIIATIIVLCRYSTWLSNKIGGNVVQVLATLILLSYTKLFRTIVLAFKSASLSCTSSGQTRLVWYMDGTIDYFSWQHVLLFAVALIFLLLAVPYTLILLFNTLIEKYVTQVRLFQKWWIKLKPLIDAYRGLYTDSCQFWTGLLLLARLVLVSVESLSFSTEYAVLVVIITLSVLLLSLVSTFRGIYQKRRLDILECWSLLNLVFLSSLAAAEQEEVGVKISVSLMLASFIGILLYHTVLRLQNVECLKKAATKMLKITKKTDTKSLVQEEEGVDVEHTKIQTITTSDVYVLREPLIDEL